MPEARIVGFSFLFAALTVVACSSRPESAEPEPAETDTVATVEPAETAEPVWPPSLHVFGDGYPEAGDACRRVGESAATIEYLDDSSILVGCPTADAASALGGIILETIDGIILVSLPAGDSMTGAAAPE
jgi:hypothetical protein